MVNGVLDDVHRPDVSYFNKEGDTAGAEESHISTRKVMPLAQENQEEILGVLQQLTNQLMTIMMKGLLKTSV